MYFFIWLASDLARCLPRFRSRQIPIRADGRLAELVKKPLRHLGQRHRRVYRSRADFVRAAAAMKLDVAVELFRFRYAIPTMSMGGGG